MADVKCEACGGTLTSQGVVFDGQRASCLGCGRVYSACFYADGNYDWACTTENARPSKRVGKDRGCA